MWQQIKQHPIRFFALISAVLLAVFLGYITRRLLDTLSSYEWCAKAIQAERITPGNTFTGLIGCIDILKLQVPVLGTALHISIAAYAGSMLVLVVIVIAGAKGSFTLPGGIGGNVSPAGEAAIEVAGAAVDKAKDITQANPPGAAPAPAPAATPAPPLGETPNPNYKGPAMPPPPA